jgi:hypothetical protein
MVIRGNPRGSGRQLAHYLLTKAENEHIWILDADGRDEMSKSEFSDLFYDMSITAELTKSNKGLYHAQINPAIGEDKLMTKEKWFEAVDIMAKELGFEDQRRAIVLHEKKGRIHAHVVWERYDHDKGKMISDSFSRLAQDRARKEMERILELQKTPHRNKQRPELKQTLTELWEKTKTAKDFMTEVDKAGYMLAEGVPRHPFMVVDENGRTFDLVRQLKGVRIKEVRERMRGEQLTPEKKAIELMRARGELASKGDKEGKEQQKPQPSSKAKDSTKEAAETAQATKAAKAAKDFADNRKDVFANQQQQEQQKVDIAKGFAENRNDLFGQADTNTDPKKKAAKGFADNRNGMFEKENEPSPKTTQGNKQDDKQADKQKSAQDFKENKDDLVPPTIEVETEKERLMREFREELDKDKKDRELDKDKGWDKEPDWD